MFGGVPKTKAFLPASLDRAALTGQSPKGVGKGVAWTDHDHPTRADRRLANRIQTIRAKRPSGCREVADVSAARDDRRRGKPPKHARTGYAEVLWRAPPTAEWARVARWCQRAQDEGEL